MKNFRFLNFWLLFTVGMATVVFNSCGKDDDNPSGSLTTDVGVMINGIKWATRNVDKPGTFTAKPEDPGMFYQWNRRVGWRYNNPLISSDGTSTWNSGNVYGVTTWEKTNDPCPAGWRMPSSNELNALVSSGSVWTTINSMNGRKFGSGSNTLFLPAAGRRGLSDGTRYGADSDGNYWSSSQYFGIFAYYLNFHSGYANADGNWNGATGCSCRCVAE